MALRRSLIRSGRWLAEACTIPAATPAAALQVLVVPGNPGNARFYECFLTLLHGAFDGTADVMAVSHLGHHADSPHHPEVFSLSRQIQHKQQLLSDLLSKRLPTLVLAHSIGSYMVLQALHQLQQAGGQHLQYLHKVVLLMPFLATDWASRRQVLLRYAASVARPLGWLAGAVGSLPRAWQEPLLQAGSGGMESHGVDAACQLLRRHSAHNNFHLAWHEFRDLNRPFDWQLLRGLGQRVLLVAAPRDMWFPEHHLQELREAAPNVQVVWREDLTHAFCLSTQQCTDIAQLVQGLAPQTQRTTDLSPAADQAPAGVHHIPSELDVAVLLDVDTSRAAAGKEGLQAPSPQLQAVPAAAGG